MVKSRCRECDRNEQGLSASSLKKTGTAWSLNAGRRERLVSEVCARLRAEYGLPRLGNPTDPVEDLVFIMLSNRTRPLAAASTFALLRARYESWEEMAAAPLGEVIGILEPIGLQSKRASQIRSALVAIRTDFGVCTLKPLESRSEADVLVYLMRLDGVSEKVAKCVMMYTMGAAVLPVDAHVHRVASRLGWTARRRPDQCSAELEALVPAEARYGLHVGCIEHGRSVCRPRRPRCSSCVIADLCPYDLEHQ